MQVFAAPLVLFDQVVPAGALTPNILGVPAMIPGAFSTLYQVTHSGLGVAAAGTFEVSADGVNWIDGNDPVLTSVTGLSVSVIAHNNGDHRWVRFRMSNGGASGGRVTVQALVRATTV